MTRFPVESCSSRVIFYEEITSKRLKHVAINRAEAYGFSLYNCRVKEMMKLSETAISNIIVDALAEEMGLFDERDRQRDLKKAKEMLLLDIPVEKISKVMNIPLEMIKTMA